MWEGAAERVLGLARDYQPPDFAHVPDADAALFLCAVDHQTGYEREHRVDGAGPYSGSELMWVVGLRSAEREPGLLTARLREAGAADVARWFYIADETVADPQRRAALWRDLATGFERDYGGSADRLLAACGGRLGSSHGLANLLAAYDAYADPLAKEVVPVREDRRAARLAQGRRPGGLGGLRGQRADGIARNAGLVAEGPLDEVRPTT